MVGSSNLDEGLRGYYTKYDCSSADVNPIGMMILWRYMLGSLTKNDLRRFLLHTSEVYKVDAIHQILSANASAELVPPTSDSDTHTQNSEQDMGLTFDQLETLGKLRKLNRLGPFGMFQRLLTIWNHINPVQIA